MKTSSQAHHRNRPTFNELCVCVCVCVCVSEKTWTGLAVKDFGPEGGLGERTFHLSVGVFRREKTCNLQQLQMRGNARRQ